MRSKVLEVGIGGLYRLWRLGAVVLMVGAALMLASCGEEPEEEAAAAEDGESKNPARGAVVSDITDESQEFFGSTVTVSGEVNDIVAPNAFTIGGEDFLGGDELLIVGAQQLPNVVEGVEKGVELGEDDIAQITGTVRQFSSVKALEDEVDYAIDDQLFEDYEGEPVVVAKKIFLTLRAERAGEQGVGADISDITDAPEEFYGQTLTVEGIVGETIEANAFVLIDKETASEVDAPEDDLAAGEGILVVNSDSFTPNLSEGQKVRVKGKFQEFDLATFEDELGTDLNDGLYTGWTEGPAILAQQIQKTS